MEIKPLQNNLHWSVATDFTPIDDLFKQLQIGPYEYLRHFSIKRFIEAYWQYFVFALIFIIGLILHGIRSEYLVNKRTHALSESLKRERKLRAESALVKSRLDKIQKVGLVGQMCSMIAHELKQPLGAAAAYCFALRRRMESGEVSTEIMEKGIERIDGQIQRASEVVNQVRSYAKGQRQRQAVDVGKTAEKILRDIQASSPDTEVEFRREDEGFIVEANPIELEIILINLVKNAIEVVKDKDSGRVVVALFSEGNSVCIKVEDNGEKMSDVEWKQLSQLAMATTKHSGLGFGLSIVAALAEDLGGRVNFERIPSGGLSVLVRLPSAKESS
ncbi:MAG: sensor histidine kinase [Parasutterella sp.]|uniref:sensor histidine kinase n=1 Tax=Parasutterella sp. TaxID=2049037 RepID=UPI00399A70CE